MAVQPKANEPEIKGETFDLFTKRRAKDYISNTHTQELVIALCGPIGSPLHNAATTIESMLRDSFGYEECKIIKLSSLIEKYAGHVDIDIPANNAYKKIESQIQSGNELRKKFGASILAELAVNDIRVDRESHKEKHGNTSYVSRRVCHIIDSIKNQEELDLLRMVYREMLYVIGVFSPLEQREEKLKSKGLEISQVYQLIDRDSGEEEKSGQTVRDTFPQCDFFLRMDSGTDAQLKNRVNRFLHLILGTKIITPTVSESAMYEAASAASNSACLSRQVGAAVTNHLGEVISTGWNDVPKTGGGLYLYDIQDTAGEKDKRCWNQEGGKCFNDEEKNLLANQLLEVLDGIVPEDKRNEALLAIKDSKKLRGLIEFSRSIHAEMHALLNAGKIAGDKIAGGKLFVTTYPCHSCARHIIAAGITEVYYIEPYRKSLATKLHKDAISERESEKDKVRILAFDGVAPGRYLDLFKARPNSRKKDGVMIKVLPKDAIPRLEKSMQAFPELESLVVKSLASQKLINVNEEDTGDGESSPPAAA